MKSLLSFALTLIFFTSAYSQNDAIDKFFQSYQNDENFTMVYVSPKMFKMVSKVMEGQEDEEIKELVKDIEGLKILSTETDPMNYYAEAKKKIPTDSYEVLMTVRDKGSNVKFLTKESSDDVIEELLLIVGGEDNFTLMSFIGKLDLNKLAKLAKKLDIDGVEHLQNLEK
jgi:trimethylamine:corrinoid methyltransferase-like protein